MTTLRSQDEIRNTVVSLGLPDHPYFMRRAARAMDLLDTGKVNFVGDEIFRVQSQFDDTIYHVELNHGNPGCTCADHQKNPGVLCKHMIAATVYQKQAPVITIVKTTDGEDGDYWRRCWLIAQGNRRILVYDERNRKLFCNCGAHYRDCVHKELVIQTVTKELKRKPIVNECGSNEAKALQDQMNGQLDSRNDNGNGAHKAPSQTGGGSTQISTDDIDPLSKPFVESERLDEQQILTSEGGNAHYLACVTELKANIQKYNKKQRKQIEKLNEYVISYKGIMELANKHHITFETAIHDDTHTVIAKGRCGTSERVSGKPINGNEVTAMELAKRNAARQLLPYAELRAVEKKGQLESEFDWKTAYQKCAKLAGGKAQVDIIINDLVNWGKLRQDNPSGYNRTEWLLIHEYCQKEARVERDAGSTNNWSYNSAVFIDRCREAIAKVRDDKSVDANELPLTSAITDGQRCLQMDKKLKTWLIEADGSKKAISCREICEQFENDKNQSIVTRLRQGIDSGADISTVEID